MPSTVTLLNVVPVAISVQLTKKVHLGLAVGVAVVGDLLGLTVEGVAVVGDLLGRAVVGMDVVGDVLGLPVVGVDVVGTALGCRGRCTRACSSGSGCGR